MFSPLRRLHFRLSRRLCPRGSSANHLTAITSTRWCHRRYSTVKTPTIQHVAVPCRSNGSVHLSILQPPASLSPSPFLLYLPSGPLFPDPHESDIIAALSATANATVVRVDYRLNNEQRYPTPVHDVLFAYDWVIDNLVRAAADQNRPAKAARLGVCGELVGGSLATMLALTECRMGTHRIAAAAVNNPIVDWIFPTDLLQPSEESDYDISQVYMDEEGRVFRRKDVEARNISWNRYCNNPAFPTSVLFKARKELFCRQDDYFDRFASPIHFFRTPSIGVTIPGLSEDELASEPGLDLESGPIDLDQSVMGKRRRAHRVYPPTGAGLRLPVMSVSVGEEIILRDQAEELVKLVRRSVLRHEKIEEEADRRIGLTLRPGAGLWSGTARCPDWRQEIEEIGTWFRSVLA